MSNKERLAYAEKRLDEAIRNGTNEDIHYWRGYRDAVSRCVERELVEDLSDGALD